MDSEYYRFGFFPEDLWIRISIPGNIFHGSIQEIINPAFTEADFYFTLKDGTVSPLRRYDKLSFRTQSVEIPESLDYTSPAYIRLEFLLTFNFEVCFWTVEAFMQYILRYFLSFPVNI